MNITPEDIVAEIRAVKEERGQRLKATFQTLVALNAFAGIADPAAWQREIRQDRQLPGRAS